MNADLTVRRVAAIGSALAGGLAAVALTACGGGSATPTAPSGAPPATAVVTTSPAEAGAATTAVLGRADRPAARGLGAARPTVIDLGGADSTGIVEGVTWQSWDGPTATGTGTAGFVAPDAPLASAVQETATIIASDLGDCDGRPAYRRVGWYFPQHGETPWATATSQSVATDAQTRHGPCRLTLTQGQCGG
jgi:hypothetical protein